MQVLQLVTPSPQPFVLRTLGGFGLFRQGEASPQIPAGKPVALLVYLSALPGRTANREQLLNLLWADREPHSGRHALRQTTWYLRQRLGDEALDVESEQVRLTLSLECDRDRFLALVEAGHLDRAVEVYHGEFLGGFAAPGGLAFEHWAEAERQRLQLLFRHAGETVARHRHPGVAAPGYIALMGTFRVSVDLAHLGGGPSERLQALVDTGATYTWVPADILARLGIEPTQQRRFVLADGREVLYGVAWASVRIGGQQEPTMVVFGDPGSEPLLGVFTLEGFGLAADPVNRRLIPVPGLLKLA